MNEDDISKRLSVIEINHTLLEREQETLKKNQEDITKDLREVSSNLNRVSSEMSLLVNNVSHLTDAIEKLSLITEKASKIELDLSVMRSRTESINKLWDIVDVLKARVDVQGTITNTVKTVAGVILVGAIGLILNHLFGQ